MKRIFDYADKLSCILNAVSLITSIAAGVVLPLMTIVFGNAVGEFNKFSAGSTDAARFRHIILNYV